jgi:PTH1 family peptidyl-tRNA hydrolase
VKLVVGLGNPGPRYAESRHNVGFAVLDELVRRWKPGEPSYDRHFEGLIVEAQRGNERLLLLRPLTYMNLSGRSVAAVQRFYKLELPDLLVVYDDLDLPVGQIRVRAEGSAGGHKGMADVLGRLGSPQIARVRVGIGRVDRSATVEYVLSRFLPEEREPIEHAVQSAADAVECWVDQGVVAAMNRFNRRAEAGPGPGEEPPADPPSTSRRDVQGPRSQGEPT